MYPKMRPWKLLSVVIPTALLSAEANGDSLFIASASDDEVYRYNVEPTGIAALTYTFTTNLNSPFGLAFSPTGELFIGNRFQHDGSLVTTGTVARFLDPTGTPVANGVIPAMGIGWHLQNPHGLAFRNRELFVVNATSDVVTRFIFDSSGNPVFSGMISEHLGGTHSRGIAFNFDGDMYVSQSDSVSLQLKEWKFTCAGEPLFAGEFTSAGTNNHGIAFSSWGEMFVASRNDHAIHRFVIDAAGNPVPNGEITGNGLSYPIDLAFSSWGELFVTNIEFPVVYRFVFDGDRNAVHNGQFSTLTRLAGIAFAPGQVAPADIDGDGVANWLDACDATPPGVAVDDTGRPLGDIDEDCDTDLLDFALFQAGFTGPL